MVSFLCSSAAEVVAAIDEPNILLSAISTGRQSWVQMLAMEHLSIDNTV